MDGEEVEEDGVAGLQIEPADVEGLPIGVDVGQLGEASQGSCRRRGRRIGPGGNGAWQPVRLAAGAPGGR
jgi:hypothetical protein